MPEIYDMDEATYDNGELPKPSLKRLGGAFIGLLEGHIELFGIEFQEEKSRSLRLFLLGGISLLLGLLILLGLSAAIIIYFWDSYRLTAILGLCGAYAVILLVCVLRMLKLLKEVTSPFQATLEELARNREQLLP